MVNGRAFMKIYDPLYGTFEIPQFLRSLVLAPEVRRLMGVRLLNAPTPTIPTLSEIRRFSHTLGVLRLALLNPHVGLTKDETRALAAAILIHDAATPPFAHLLEYYLKDRSGWDHESALPGLLTGHEFAGNRAHQIVPGEELKFRLLCRKAKIDFDLVMAIVQKRHHASRLLFGSLDFDNLDNVARMAWALGLSVNTGHFIDLARALGVSVRGELFLSEELSSALATWAETRARVYQVLVFDQITVATQAVLTKAIRVHYSDENISDIRWASQDDDLIGFLTASPQTKELMIRHFNQTIPACVLMCRLNGSLADLGFSSRDSAIDFIEEMARSDFGIRQPFGYVFVDRGAFSKEIECQDPATRKKWSMGITSNSVVFYCFAQRASEATRVRFKRAFHDRFGDKAFGSVDAN